MKKGWVLFWVFVLFIPLVSSANENISKASSLETNVRFVSSIDIVPESTDYILASLEINMSFVPRDYDFQEVKNLNHISDPKGRVYERNGLTYSWQNIQSDEVIYGYGATVESFPKLPEIKESISFPIRAEVDPAYLSPTETINSDSFKIKQKATEIVAGETDVYRAAHKIGVWVQENIDYDLSTLTAESSQDAEWVLDNRKGVCDEMTTLFVAMLRSVGIPAKFVSGMVHTSAIDDGFGAHAWAEIYLPDQGWVPFDPTFGQLGFVDATHIKMDEPRDFRDSSVGFLWKVRDGTVTPGSIDNIDVEVLSFDTELEPHIELTLKPLIDDVGAASFVPIEVQIRNLEDYYVPVQLFLTKVPAYTGSSSKQVLLKPKETGSAYFIVRTPEVLEENYNYYSTVEVQDFFGAVGNTTVHYDSSNKLVSEGEAKSKVSSEDQTTEVVDSTFFCAAEKLVYYTYEDKVKISCTVKSFSNKNIQNAKVCVEDDCRTFNLGIAESKDFEFIQPVEVKDYEASLDFGEESFNEIVSLEVRNTPTLEIEFRDTPDALSYYETRELIVKLKASEPLGTLKIDLGEINLKENLHQLGSSDGELVLFVSGKDVYLSEEINLKISFNDRNNKEYSVEEYLQIKVTEVPFFKKIWSLLFGWI